MCILSITVTLVASEAMVASTASEVKFDMRSEISYLDYPGTHMQNACIS